MLFKQVQEIVDGIKTQTRRIAKSNTTMCFGNGTYAIKTWEYEGVKIKTLRIKWEVGRDYAVVPKRGEPTAVWIPSTGNWYRNNNLPFGTPPWQPLRIKILSIHREPLQSISHADTIAEGVANVSEYRTLWEGINTHIGTRWEDNPYVWVIEFEVMR